jgi:hypothetical protein
MCEGSKVSKEHDVLQIGTFYTYMYTNWNSLCYLIVLYGRTCFVQKARMSRFYVWSFSHLIWPRHQRMYSFIHPSMALQPFFGPWPFLQFHILFHTVGRTPWTSDQPDGRPLPTQNNTNTEWTHTQTSMPWLEFEPTIPAFERAKTVHALHRAATVIGACIGRYNLRQEWLKFQFNKYLHFSCLK